MDDDWDLHAVVRGCAANAFTPTVSAAANNNNNNNNPLPLSFHDDQNIFNFSVEDGAHDPFMGLHEIYQEFCCDDDPPPGAPMAFPPAVSVQQPQQELMQIKPSAPLRLNMQIQENVQFNLCSPPHNFPVAVPQPVRPRRRKNQQIKMIRQMTQEELSADSWAWRKYGQKPIKGSPYPRNYYRCSTSKGCAARKQVERSPDDPEIFVVSFSGEHTHPRPSHRSSLAGSTRSKLDSQSARGSGSGSGGGCAVLSQKGSMASSSSPAAARASFSPKTPSMEGEAAAQSNDVQMAEDDEGVGDDDETNVMMINPSDMMNDDDVDGMFRGFQDSDDHSSGGGDFFSSGLMSPPWTPTSSAAPFNDGC